MLIFLLYLGHLLKIESTQINLGECLSHELKTIIHCINFDKGAVLDKFPLNGCDSSAECVF